MPVLEKPEDLPFKLPKSTEEVDAAWMTALLKHRKLLTGDQHVAEIKTSGVGMTAGYFSSIVKVECIYSAGVADTLEKYFVVKCMPLMELLPPENLKDIFARDMRGYYEYAAETFYPRPDCYLASYDIDEGKNLWGFVTNDLDKTHLHMTHETPLDFDDVLMMIPRLATVAATFEGCHDEALNPEAFKRFFPGEENLGDVHVFADPGFIGMLQKQGQEVAHHMDWFLHSKSVTPDSGKHEWGAWDQNVGEKFMSSYMAKLNTHWKKAHPENGASSTLGHGDIRGDNLFFTKDKKDFTMIDFQLMNIGPIPGDLAFLMTTGSVTPETYARTDEILMAFYEAFTAKSKVYPKDKYSYAQFEEEFALMSQVILVYYAGFGAAYWEGAAKGVAPGAPEIGPKNGKITRVDQLSQEDLRKRSWWKPCLENIKYYLMKYKQYDAIKLIPEDEGAAPKQSRITMSLKAQSRRITVSYVMPDDDDDEE